MKYLIKNSVILDVSEHPIFDRGVKVDTAYILRWAIENLAGFNVGGPAIVAQARVDRALREAETLIRLEIEDRDKLITEIERCIGWTPQGLGPVPYPLTPGRLMLQVIAALRTAEME